MLSFEVSAIDIVLVISVVIILLLYLIKPTQHSAGSEGNVLDGKSGIIVKILSIFKNRESRSHSQTNSFECPHYFGYLRDIPGGDSIPEECYVCPQMIRCAARETLVGSPFDMKDKFARQKL